MSERPLALLVDSDPDTVDLYAHCFSLHSWYTAQAADGASALTQALHLRPDAIVTETWLPVVDGIRLVEILKSDSSTAAIPVVALTADARETVAERARQAGCDAVLFKPCLPDDLLATVVRLAASNRPLRAPSSRVRARAVAAIARAVDVQARAEHAPRRAPATSLKTTTPTALPPELRCPVCSAALRYEHSFVGGVATHREQWDYLRCPSGCGAYQYRPRTRRLKAAR